MKFLFVAALIPRFGYTAVIVCEPIIWSVMTVQLPYQSLYATEIEETQTPVPGACKTAI